MTQFHHQKRSGRRKAAKKRERTPMGIGRDLDLLLTHRELEALRRPTRERLWKLEQARRAKRSEQ